MGIFGKAIDSRTSQILKNTFGNEIDFDFVAGGTLTFNTTQLTIRPFMAAVNDQGVFFIQNSQVVLVLPWSKILGSEPSSWDSSDDITVEIDLPRDGRKKQFPYCNWNLATLKFNDLSDQIKFRNKYAEMKLKEGFTRESLTLFHNWIKFDLDSLDSLETFHKLNANWSTEEIRSEYYSKFADFQDGQSLLFCMGRFVCAGYVPGKILNLIHEEFKRLNSLQADLSGQNYVIKDKNLETLNSTASLPWPGDADLGMRTVSEDWVLGSIQTSQDEWQSPSHRNERLVAIQVIGRGEGLPSIRVWNEFHHGDSTIVFDVDSFKTSNSVSLNGLQVKFPQDSVAKALSIWT